MRGPRKTALPPLPVLKPKERKRVDLIVQGLDMFRIPYWLMPTPIPGMRLTGLTEFYS